MDGLMTEYRRVLFDGSAVLTERHGDVLVARDGREVSIEDAIHLPPSEPTKIVAVHLNYDSRTKELLGLVASAVLRCNDCIDYHLEQCVALGYTKEQLVDAMNVALVVGGSIVIPHARHAMLSIDELFAEKQGAAKSS